MQAVYLYCAVKKKQFNIKSLLMIARPSCQAMDGTAGCRQTLWEICIGLWSRPVCPPRLTTDPPVAWSTSAHLSVEWMTPCSMTSFTACGSSIAHLRYNNMFWAFMSLHKCMIYWLITNWYLHLLTECPSSRHKPIIGLFRVRISVLIKPQTYRLCLCLTQPASLLLETKGTKNLLLPARLYISFPTTAPSTSLTVQEHKDSAGCYKRQKRCLAGWNNKKGLQ